MSTCIIIPCYNEEKRLDANRFTDFLADNPQIHIFFVNDGSKDRTAEILDSHFESNKQVRHITLEKNVGKGEAIRKAVLVACKQEYDFIGYFDADLSTDLSEIFRMLEVFKVNPSIQFVMGSRVAKLGNNINRRLFQHWRGRLAATFIDSFYLKIMVYDTQCGCLLYTSPSPRDA